MGKVDEGKVWLYKAFPDTSGIIKEGDNGEHLKLGPNWAVEKCHVPETCFKIEDSLTAFSKTEAHLKFMSRPEMIEFMRKNPITVTEDYIYKPIKIELMQFGSTEKVEERERKEAGLKVLQPQTVEVTV